MLLYVATIRFLKDNPPHVYSLESKDHIAYSFSFFHIHMLLSWYWILLKGFRLIKQHHQRLQLDREHDHPIRNSLGTNENLEEKTANPKDRIIIQGVIE